MNKNVMSRFVMAAVFVVSAFSGFAQNATADFEKKISEEFCKEFEKIAPSITKENMDMQVGLLILPILNKFKDDIKKEWKLDAENPDDLEKIGYKIGQAGALGCKSFMNFVMTNMDAIGDNGTARKQEVAGTLLKVEGQPFSFLVVQNKAGKTEKIYWLEFFEGADKLTGTASSYLNKPVTVTYKEMEVYDPQNKEYKKIKVATGLKN